MFASVGEFVEALERSGELVRITEPISPVLEIGALADVAASMPAPHGPAESTARCDPARAQLGGPAILCERVAGSDLPVLINAYGSYRRVEMALGCAHGGLAQIADRLAQLTQPSPPRSLREGLALARRVLPALMQTRPGRARGRVPCQEIVIRDDDIDLTALPLLRCWPCDGDPAAVGYRGDVNARVAGCGHPSIDDAAWERDYRGRYITFAGVHTIHADDAGVERPASHNIGMYRAQLLGKSTLAMHWHMHHDGAAHWRSWAARGEAMPIAIALGGPSVLAYAATAPLPPGMSELLLAGLLNHGGIRLAPGKTVPIRVPADSEIIIEGFVAHEAAGPGFDPRVEGAELGPGAAFEGPFGDHTGFYSLPDRYPVMRVTAITMRRGAIFPATIVGLPPQEDYYLGKATERIFLPLLRTLVPDIEDYDLPMFGAFHNCAFVRIDKAYPMQARRVMHAIWGAGQMAWTKLIVVVDGDVDVHDRSAVLAAVAGRCRPGRDLERVRGPLDILDHAAPWLGAGGKLGFDATRRIAGERGVQGGSDGWQPPDAAERTSVVEQIAALPGVLDAAWPEELAGWVLVRCDPAVGRSITRRAVELIAGRAPFVIVVGPDAQLADPDSVLFHWCANMDPQRDTVEVDGTLGFDASPKQPGAAPTGEPIRDWPPVLTMDESVRSTARQRLARAVLDG